MTEQFGKLRESIQAVLDNLEQMEAAQQAMLAAAEETLRDSAFFVHEQNVLRTMQYYRRQAQSLLELNESPETGVRIGTFIQEYGAFSSQNGAELRQLMAWATGTR